MNNLELEREVDPKSSSIRPERAVAVKVRIIVNRRYLEYQIATSSSQSDPTSKYFNCLGAERKLHANINPARIRIEQRTLSTITN